MNSALLLTIIVIGGTITDRIIDFVYFRAEEHLHPHWFADEEEMDKQEDTEIKDAIRHGRDEQA